ncbi:MAG TPA: DUF4388 domain-containing protein [Beggiatoa sp.]|nr:DUF4388 domain-containing protein [Beggiatoa sp.]
MSSTTSLLPYSDLMAKIHHLSSKGQTGTLFITSDEGHLVRIVLNDGRITYLVFDTQHRGYDAIPLINTIKFGRLQFAEGVFETAQEVPLPSTNEIFKLFQETEQGNLDIAATVVSDISPNLIKAAEQIKKALANYIGPFAAIVCDEYIDNINNTTGFRTIDDVMIMIEVVSLEIDDPAAENAFKVQSKKELIQKGLL